MIFEAPSLWASMVAMFFNRNTSCLTLSCSWRNPCVPIAMWHLCRFCNKKFDWTSWIRH